MYKQKLQVVTINNRKWVKVEDVFKVYGYIPPHKDHFYQEKNKNGEIVAVYMSLDYIGAFKLVKKLGV